MKYYAVNYTSMYFFPTVSNTISSSGSLEGDWLKQIIIFIYWNIWVVNAGDTHSGAKITLLCTKYFSQNSRRNDIRLAVLSGSIYERTTERRCVRFTNIHVQTRI